MPAALGAGACAHALGPKLCMPGQEKLVVVHSRPDRSSDLGRRAKGYSIHLVAGSLPCHFRKSVYQAVATEKDTDGLKSFTEGLKSLPHKHRNRRWWGVVIEGGKKCALLEDHNEAEGMMWGERDQEHRKDVWLQVERV